jgi:peroxiredoxin
VLIHGTWCHACLEQILTLQRRYAWLKELGVEVLVVSADDPAQVDAFLSSLSAPLRFTLVPDPKAAFSRALGLFDEATQTRRSALMLVDPEGGVRFALIDQHGIPEQAVLLQAISQLPPAR